MNSEHAPIHDSLILPCSEQRDDDEKVLDIAYTDFSDGSTYVNFRTYTFPEVTLEMVLDDTGHVMLPPTDNLHPYSCGLAERLSAAEQESILEEN